MKSLNFKSLLLICLMAFAQDSNAQWLLNGNAGTATSWLGTTNNFPLVFKTNNAERMRITQTGSVGIGIAAPTQRLQLSGGNMLFDVASGSSSGNLFFAGVTAAGANGLRLSYNNGAPGLTTGGMIDVRTAGATDGLIFRVDNNNGGSERMRICANGNVGIGIIAPAHKLDVFGTAGVSTAIAKFADSEGRRIFFVPKLANGGYTFASKANDAGIFWADNSGFNSAAGFVIAPQNGIWAGIRLAADGSATLPGYNTTIGYSNTRLGLGSAAGLGLGWGTSYVGFNATRSKTSGSWTFESDGSNNGGNVVYGDVDGTIRFATERSTGGLTKTLTDADILNRTKMTIKGDGSVVIGNVTTPSGYKLYVETGILTEKVKVAVKTSTDWADYVFADDYKLRPLEEVADFVKKEKHLPGVPSAEAMVNEGLDVAKMDAKLLEKIEELTLYMLQLDRDNKALRQEVEVLKNKK